MNSCILMARIVRAPELRYTQDNQTPLAQMLVEFEPLREGDPPARLKVVGWGNLANEIQANYQEGDEVIIEGRLTMNILERPEGFKEKRAELITSRIHKVTASPLPMTGERPSNVVPLESRKSSAPKPSNMEGETPSDFDELPAMTTPASPSEKDLDDIPFVQSVSLRLSAVDLQDPWEMAAKRPGTWLHGFSDL